ncbi:MAG: hypothetical protein P4L40_19140 [Terracidiphilus sp.]|nr:hypothetical protein [Terracidiphilus sp.]
MCPCVCSVDEFGPALNHVKKSVESVLANAPSTVAHLKELFAEV